MRRPSLPGAVLVACALISPAVLAQISIPGAPRIVQLPSDDFVWSWGSAARVEDRERPDFEIIGIEQSFRCELEGSFRRASRLRDYYNLREFEQGLSSSFEFIQDATRALNYYYQTNELDWAIMNCVKPEGVETEESAEERQQRALERAQRARERRREREQDD